jgi:hypothetical protein
MRKTLYVDVDDTLYSALPLYSIAEREMHGTDRLRKRYYEPHEMVEMYGEDFKEIFYRALSPEKVHDREMYPNVPEALSRLYDEYDVHFLTHTHFPNEMYVPLREWLRQNLTIPFNLTAIPEDIPKVEVLEADSTTYGIIDDRFKTLRDAYRAGYRVYGMKQHTNCHTRVPYVKWFEDWRQVPDLIFEMEMV